MGRAIWSGAVSFGLVNVPVKLYGAVSTKGVRFHQVEEGTGARIRYQRISEETGKEVPYERIQKGYDLGGGRLVVIDPDELDDLAPEATRVIDIEDFVDIEEIDPVFFDSTYYLVPDGRGAAKPYRLLLEVMASSGRVAIGRFVMRSKQYLSALRPRDGVLTIETMHFADEVVDPRSIDGLPVSADLGKREIAAAEQLVDSLTTKWDPDRYEDTYREQVLDLVERKAKGEEITAPKRREDRGEVVDLMSALEASVAEGRQRKRGASKAQQGDGRRSKPEPLVDLTREELYERAQDADIPGRSRMSKDELVDALRDAS